MHDADGRSRACVVLDKQVVLHAELAHPGPKPSGVRAREAAVVSCRQPAVAGGDGDWVGRVVAEGRNRARGLLICVGVGEVQAETAGAAETREGTRVSGWGSEMRGGVLSVGERS